MGLSICGYECIERSDWSPTTDLDWDAAYDLNVHKVYVPDRRFARALDGFDGVDGDTAGWWRTSGRECSGYWTYGGWNRFRDELARAYVGRDARTVWREDALNAEHRVPLADLINFSDCEGWFGPEACQRVYDGLVGPRVDASVCIDSDELSSLAAIFGLAAGFGAVSFG